ncbi:oligoendopeptidase F [Ilyobacter polytropus]|uniref:Oligopeptidase F n=1 Tax=Ilyobacter polytropus (strain ATCC 51220 / DSM 2926 / LMG 16218 / CuHBu1) TaxID=572544 RepID=E3H6Q0_ILYPC|nr:oligoendopeptidase F [Ilyobacter polytropus]ADO82419.1 oligopeptidase F [Ilyobacter polytropus DSM 2926]
MRKRLLILALIAVFGIAGHAYISGKNMGKPSNEKNNEKISNEGKEGVIEVVKEDKTLKREDIDQKYKWNLNDIYENWEEWEADLVRAKELMEEIPKYRGKIKNDPKAFSELVAMENELSKITDEIYLYPYLMRDLDSTDEVASKKLQEIMAIYTQYSATVAWINPEILEIPKGTMIKWIDENKELEEHRFQIMELYRLQGHVLDAEKEKLLSYYGQFMGAPGDIYKELTTSDIKWNEVELSTGEKTKVTNAVYSKILSTNKNQEDRKKAFEALYTAYADNQNTYAAIYRSILQKSNATVQARGYGSTLAKALEGNNIPVEVYENLIKVTRENTQPLQRYVNLRKKLLGLDEYHYYDNQITLVDYNREFEYDEAKELVLKSVAPLGDEYVKGMEKAVSQGWLDVYETPNKRSGAYSLGIYGVHPYMLLNYNGTLDSVFTLGHELGHTMHTMLSSENQPYSTHGYTIFVAEVASTFNERLLLDNMLTNTKDPIERIALIEQSLGNVVGTYFIQTLFADYEYQVHKIVENGGAITPDVLSGIMDQLFKDYFGDTVAIDELQKIIWARIPHFYNSPYYVYQYATCFASSAVLHDRITNEKYSEDERKVALNKYLDLLKSGGSDHPMNQLKKAGVDLTETETIEAVSKDMNALLDILEKEMENLERK